MLPFLDSFPLSSEQGLCRVIAIFLVGKREKWLGEEKREGEKGGDRQSDGAAPMVDEALLALF